MWANHKDGALPLGQQLQGASRGGLLEPRGASGQELGPRAMEHSLSVLIRREGSGGINTPTALFLLPLPRLLLEGMEAEATKAMGAPRPMKAEGQPLCPEQMAKGGE